MKTPLFIPSIVALGLIACAPMRPTASATPAKTGKPSAAAPTPAKKSTVKNQHSTEPLGPWMKGRTLRVRTTAYVGKRNAISKPLSHGPVTSAAADWSNFPLGTRFRIKQTGKTYVIDDYGSALTGTRTIDLAQRNRAGIKAWGARWVDIEILEWGSSRKSLEILTPRAKTSYVKPMVVALRQQTQGIPREFHRLKER